MSVLYKGRTIYIIWAKEGVLHPNCIRQVALKRVSRGQFSPSRHLNLKEAFTLLGNPELAPLPGKQSQHYKHQLNNH